jgi:nucleotide-binding universal stress UspA family protein
MSDVEFPDVPFVRSVLHPTDFSDASESAFRHALALALRRQTLLTLLHVDSGAGSLHSWSEFPPVRKTLEDWGLLDSGSPRSDVAERLGLDVAKVNLRHRDVLSAILDYIDHHSTDLIVLATEGREGIPRWLRDSVAEQLARRSRTMTLFVPRRGTGFVGLRTGRVALRRILVPVDDRPDPRGAIAYASRAARMSDAAKIEIELLHVGPVDGLPRLEPPDVDRCAWSRVARTGDVVSAIVDRAEETSADLVVMATEGRQGILDALRGSVTEQVLRRAGCPVLGVPTDAP